MREKVKLQQLINAGWMEIRMTEQCAMIRGKNDETMRDQWKLEWLNNAWES